MKAAPAHGQRRRRHAGVDRRALDRRLGDLRIERSTHEKRWKECCLFGKPTADRWVMGDSNKGNRGKSHIVDTSIVLARRVCRDGLLQGTASPEKPWFGLASPWESFNANEQNALWLEACRDVVLQVMGRANLYAKLRGVFDDEIVVGTSPMLIWDDDEDLVRYEVSPPGSYYLAQDHRYNVDTYGREVTMTARQIVQFFVDERGVDPESLPQEVRRALRPTSSSEQRFNIGHLIEPNPQWVPDSDLPWEWRWREFYWLIQGESVDAERDGPRDPTVTAGGKDSGVIDEGGFQEFPVAVARWGRNDQDVYATDSPMIDALGDVKQLQSMERWGSQALTKSLAPPMIFGQENDGFSHAPGAINVDPGMNGPSRGGRAAYDVPLPLREVEEKQDKIRERIGDHFLVPLFQMLISDSRLQRATAEEVRQLDREALRLIGPIHTAHVPFFDTLVERTFSILVRRSELAWSMGEDGVLPRPPSKDIANIEIKAVYESEVAQLLRAAGLLPVERHLDFLADAGHLWPEMLDTVDPDSLAREHRDRSGVPRSIAASPERVQAVRQARADAARAEAEAAQVQQLARGAKDLSQTQVGDTTALEAIAEGVSQ